MLLLLSPGCRHLPTLLGGVRLQRWGKIWPIGSCENDEWRWWELSSLLSLSLTLFLYLHCDGFTRPYLGNSHKLREGPATCPPNEYKTKPFTNRWVTEVKCVQFTPFFFPLFHSWHWALHQPILALFKKERKEREKQNRAKVWELFLLPLFQSEWFHCC